MNKFIEIFQYVQLTATMALVATFPLSDTNPFFRVAMAFFIVTYIADVILTRRYMKVATGYRLLYFSVMLALFLLGFVYLPFSHTDVWFKPMMELRLPLLIFSIVGLFGFNSKHRFSYFVHFMPLLAFLYALYVFAGINLGDFFSHGADRSYLFQMARVERLNQHMKYNFFMNTAVLCFVWIFVGYKFSKLKALCYTLLIAIPVYTLFITEGRSGFLAFVMVCVSVILYYTIKFRKWILLGVYLFLFLGAAAYSLTTKWRLAPEHVKAEPRLFLWRDVAFPLISQEPVTGYGVSDAQAETMRLKDEKLPPELDFLWTPDDRVDVHNQYMQTGLEFGVIGEILLLFLYIFPIALVSGKRRAFMIVFVMLSMWQSFFDLFLMGQFGIMFCLTVILTLLPLEPKDFVRKELGV